MRYQREDGCRAWITYGMLSPAVVKELLKEYGSYSAIYDRFVATSGASLERYALPHQLAALRKQAETGEMHEMMRTMQRLNMGIIALDDAAYPELLAQIPDAPPLLFYIGSLDCLSSRCVTMVGSRSASRKGMEAAHRIARDLSRAGVTIVSGLAVGIDTASHLGCLEGGSPSIGVAACGLDVDYPAESRQLKQDIIQSGGLLLSESALDSRALPWRFPVRNRIMSGLSSAVLMMEARPRSGSMTTVQHALDQGREVYAYPGEAGSPYSEGAHQLLRDGANYFQSAEDVLADLKWQHQHQVDHQPPARPSVKLNPDQSRVMQLLQGGEKSFDQLAAASGLDAPALSSALTMLQILGQIKPLPGKLYTIADH